MAIEPDNEDSIELLPKPSSLSNGPLPSQRSPAHPTDATRPAWRKHLRFYILIFALQFTIHLGSYLTDLPLVRLLERKICRDNLGSIADEDETMCKIPGVQDKLAYILELKPAFDAIPALIGSLWYASLADKWGRRPMMTLNCVGEVLSLGWVLFIGFGQMSIPPEALWLAAFFSFIGGGLHVLSSLSYTMIADVVTEKERAQIFSLTYAVIFFTSMIAPILAASIMANLSVPFLIVSILLGVRFILIWCLPETAPSHTKSTLVPSDEGALIDQREITEVATQPRRPSANVVHPQSDSMGQEMPNAGMSERVRHMLRRPQLQFCFLAFFFKRIAFSSETLLYQYASDVLSTKLSGIAWLRSLQAMGATLVTAIGVPLCTKFLINSMHQSTLTTSFMLVQGSLVILTVGYMALRLSHSSASLGLAMFLCGTGEGLTPSLQAVALETVTESYNAALFALMNVIDMVGRLIGGPLMAFLFSFRDSAGHSLGFCFLLSASLFGMLLVLSGFVPKAALLNRQVSS